MLSQATQATPRPKPSGSDLGIRSIRVLGQRFKVAIRPSNAGKAGASARTPLLLMNGIGANLELLQPLVDTLDPALDVIRFDAPGVGGSPTPALPYRFPALAFLVGRLLDALGYSRVDVLGISWGGALAQQFALQHPVRCRRLVLVSTGTGALMVPGEPAVLAKLATPRRYTDTSYMAAIAPELYGGRVDPAQVREFAEKIHPGNHRGYFYQMLGGAGWTSLPWLPCVRQRTLIVAGDEDRIIPVINARMMHQLIPHSKLHIFHGGHLGLVLQANELAPVINSFLADA